MAKAYAKDPVTGEMIPLNVPIEVRGGASDVTKDYVDKGLEGKVDKVQGKSLVDDTEIARLSSVSNYDDTQVKKDIKDLQDAGYITKDANNLTHYTKTDDADKRYLQSIPKASQTVLGGVKVGDGLTVSEDGTLSAIGGGGSSSDVDKNYVDNELKKKVDKVEGKQLSTEDYTTEEKNKLAGLENYTLTKQKVENVLTGDVTTHNHAAQLAIALADYVKKVSGKDLSSNDFTNELKLKLEGLSNYNDEAVQQAITALNNRLDTLVGTSASEAIDTFNEIEAFLQGITDKQTLTGLLNDLKQEITKTIPTQLSQLTDDATHRLTTDEEKSAWNAKSNFDGDYESLSNKPTAATTAKEGLMSIDDKKKLDGIEAGAQKNAVTSVAGRTGAVVLTKSDITDFPSSLPASDVPDWAKQPNKPSYTAEEVGALPDTTEIPTYENATQSKSGLMSKEDKKTLDELKQGGGNNEVEVVQKGETAKDPNAKLIVKLGAKSQFLKDVTNADPNETYGRKGGQWVPVPKGGGESSVEVVDNLTTDSATKALSARQGKILNETIGNIGSILDNINGEVI